MFKIFLHALQPACVAHKKCGVGLYTESIGTTSGDPICKACKAGQFKSKVSSSSISTDKCDDHSKCAVNEWIIVEGTGSADNQ